MVFLGGEMLTRASTERCRGDIETPLECEEEFLQLPEGIK